MLTLVKDGEAVTAPPDPAPAITPPVALICALKRAPLAKNVIVIAEGWHGDVTVSYSTMPAAEGLDLAAQGVRLLGMSLRNTE